METTPLMSPTVARLEQSLESPPDQAESSDADDTRSPGSHQNETLDQTLRRETAFTPLLTPKGDQSGSMVLLSPARTISETLTTLATTTGKQLEEIWDELGYSPEERASELSDLLVKFRDLCEQKIAEEKGVVEASRKEIAETKEKIRKTAAALKTDVDSTLIGIDSGRTLTDELASLEAVLEGLSTAADAAREDLRECSAYIVEAHDALGIEADPRWLDIESDLTSTAREAFRQKMSEMKDETSSRMVAIVQLVRDCQHLMNDLRIEAEKNGTELDRMIAGSLVRSKDGSPIMASKFRSPTCVGISAKALEELTKRVAELHTEKRRRKEKLQDMGAEIALLWEKLHVPEEDQRAFTQSVQGLGTDTIEKGEQELIRLHRLKSEMLGKLIDEARETIVDLWDEMNATPDYRDEFEPMKLKAVSLYDDRLLDQHEEYICALRSRLEQMKPILRLIERREVVLQERFKYEELQKDSDRLKQRGAELTKQLMEEEKMARRIKRDLPKLTDLLQEKLLEWKTTNNEDFQYKGKKYLEVMEVQEEEWNKYKAEEMQRKLKKKQEEKANIENRFGAATLKPHVATKASGRPLGETNSRKIRAHDKSKKSALTTKSSTVNAIGI